MATDTRNEDIVKKYFDMVQEEIKRLISEDKEIKPEQVQQFNDEIFNQDEEMKAEIQKFIDQASMNNLDIKRIAKTLYDKFKVQVKNNVFNQKDVQNVPNTLMGERKFIKTYESFMNEYYEPSDKPIKPKWNGKDYKILYDQLIAKAKEGEDFLEELGNPKPKSFNELVTLLRDYDTEESNQLAYDISTLIGMMNFFGAEREIELSKLN